LQFARIAAERIQAMPTDVTTSNAAADIILAMQTAQAPSTLQVRSSLQATHLLIVPANQIVLPSLEPLPVDPAGLVLAFDMLKALHAHAQATASTARMTSVEPLLRIAWAHLNPTEPPEDSPNTLALQRYLCGVSDQTPGLFTAQLAAWEHLEHHPSNEAQTVTDFIGLCLSLANQLLPIARRARPVGKT
jgi:hypothetical protein